jgi:hypothetical protein
MNTYQIFFDDKDSLITGMNATLQEAKKYYLGQVFVSHECEDRETCCGKGETFHTAIRVQPIPMPAIFFDNLPKNAQVFDCQTHYEYEDNDKTRFFIAWEGYQSATAQNQLKRMTQKE